MSRYAAPPPAPFAHVALRGPHLRDAERAELQAEVDAYLAAGGTIRSAPTLEPVPRPPHKGPAVSAQRIRKPWSPAEVDMVRKMRAEGSSLRLIAEAVTQAFGYPRSRPSVEALCAMRSIRLGRESLPRAGNRGRIKPKTFEDDV